MKTFFVTGSSRGLGREIVLAALRAGHNVAATARNRDDLTSLESEYPDQVLALSMDVTSQEQVSRSVQAAIQHFRHIDVLVNNAGYANMSPVEDTSMEEFCAQIETNLFGPIRTTKELLPHFRERGTGYIFQLSSVGGRIGPVGRAPYAAAKWGIEGFSESLSKEVRLLGIRVCIIEPGGFRTDFAGASTSLVEGRQEYSATVGEAIRFQRAYDGRQPGDPAKAAEVIVKLSDMENPPLRLLLGSDAFEAVLRGDSERMEETKKWEQLSRSTDF